MSTTETVIGTGVWLADVSWEDYLRLRESPANSHVRMTYRDGVLELMSPSKPHERIASLLRHFIQDWMIDRAIPTQVCGSVTFQRHDLQRGLEPDGCYYIQHADDVRDREELDLSIDPPPDLVVEVDITSPSRGRLPIYASLGVPEVWIWRGQQLRVLRLDTAGQYQPSTASACLPGFPLGLAESLVARRQGRDDTALFVQFRQGIRGGDAAGG